MYFKWKKLCALSKKISLSAFSGCLQLMRLKKKLVLSESQIFFLFIILFVILYLMNNIRKLWLELLYSGHILQI